MAKASANEEFNGHARFKTEQASKYIAQLCKHFAHKVDAEYTEEEGQAVLPGATLTLNATPDALEIRLSSETLRDLTKGRYILEDHLVRFAFREQLYCLDWTVECVSR